MKTNKQAKIRVPKSGFKRSRFNWSHDVNTTYSWGAIQPTQVKMIQPNSKTTMSTQELVRLAPMVAPTFGRVKLKTFNQFVGMSDIFPNYSALMAQQPVNKIGGTKVPKLVPSARLGQLSLWVLYGARCTVYWKDPTWTGDDLINGLYKTTYRKLSSDLSTLELNPGATTIRNALVSSGVIEVALRNYQHLGGLGTRVYFNPKPLAGNSGWNNTYLDTGNAQAYTMPLALTSANQLFPVDRSYVRGAASPYATIAALDDDLDYEVTFEGADYVIEGEITAGSDTFAVAFAFELSDAGKRFRKILQGCGYQINFSSERYVSILPILAQYKAYYDVFGLQLYQNWESTPCAKLINRIEHYFVEMIGYNNYYDSGEYINCLPEIDSSVDNNSKTLFTDFMITQVANEWYTEDADYIGAHIDKLSVSPEVDKSGFLSVTNYPASPDGSGIGAPNISSYNVQNADGTWTPTQVESDRSNLVVQRTATHDFINNVMHGEVDAELLKRIYKWTNRNTILGREIAALLRAQGLGDYVDSCKSNYIGATDDLITISDVVSLAATADAHLGEFGGKGLEYTETKTLVFENDELGYWVTLSTIVPQAGYTQGIDPTLFALDKFSLYNPDYDAIGMELTTKDVIVGDSYNSRLAGAEASGGGYGFGFIPRYSKFKVAQNLVNGDFNRHNRRNTYLPYTLDKQIACNDYSVVVDNYTQATGAGYSEIRTQMARSAESKELPVANPVWRTPTQYSWMGNFDRIFFNSGSRTDFTNGANGVGFFAAMTPGFQDFNDDNFLSHAIYEVNCYAPMKPIEESYGLDEDDPNGKAGSDFVKKEA